MVLIKIISHFDMEYLYFNLLLCYIRDPEVCGFCSVFFFEGERVGEAETANIKLSIKCEKEVNGTEKRKIMNSMKRLFAFKH